MNNLICCNLCNLNQVICNIYFIINYFLLQFPFFVSSSSIRLYALEFSILLIDIVREINYYEFFKVLYYFKKKS